VSVILIGRIWHAQEGIFLLTYLFYCHMIEMTLKVHFSSFPFRAMCFIDFGLPVVQDGQLPNGVVAEKIDSQKGSNKKLKRKAREEELRQEIRNNFDFFAFKDPVLFVGHLSDNSVLMVEKRWMDVVEGFGAPVHRHIYGT
jgi:U3 small nucleolar RNA-associated protein 4